MGYLYRYPEDTMKWVNKEKRFNSLAWLRDELPKSERRRKLYNTVNDSTSTHVNLRPIDAFSTLRSDEKGIRYLSVGPNPYPIEEPNPIGLVSTIISYPVRVLWQSNPRVMDSTWWLDFIRLMRRPNSRSARLGMTPRKLNDLSHYVICCRHLPYPNGKMDLVFN